MAMLLAVLLAAGCGTEAADDTTLAPPADTTTTIVAPPDDEEGAGSTAYPAVTSGSVGEWVPEILSRIPHDPEAFTQGLLVDGDIVWESTGRYEQSTLRRTDRATGDVLESVPLDPELFAEGLELVGDRLIQLTWQEEIALVWDAATLEEIDSFTYEGEGWGLCQHGPNLVMSDGSATLTFRDPETFEAVDSVEVTRSGEPVTQLNELECVDDLVFANVWRTNDIVVIDPEGGEVVAVIDATELDMELEDVFPLDVLNGIAYDPATDTFLLSGKLWPTTFEVRFIEG